MCTAISYASRFFGRNLDVCTSYGEGVINLPSKYKLSYKKCGGDSCHYAIIGIGSVRKGIPLFFDGANEKGLYMAALNFIDNAVYHKSAPDFFNLTHYEIIPFILSRCADVKEARGLLSKINITDDTLDKDTPPAQLHWFICDKKEAVTVEPMLDGLAVYDNPYGVLTNNPPFPFHLQNVKYHLHITKDEAKNGIAPEQSIKPTSYGLGGVGLPGDFSSHSRFLRTVFVKSSLLGKGVTDAIHVLQSAMQYRGCVKAGDSFQYTRYTAVFDSAEQAYYYNTYDDFTLRQRKIKLDGEMEFYPL